ncbi:photosynthetic complex assembly protein PuhC [Rhodocyclus tenuis]|uniref:Putative photosynthetic complex assembly protein n=1 Tax=Rhodocyclus tenuis TaxID=1066 RepID=A0A840GBB7_RHOTE|nr:photosynthetic complex assembly protein PuhC [Rhodocyclus tenuis]MBB4249136.1 putative photosynthetic complex assembly protein [Rhodocyclus tenuis]
MHDEPEFGSQPFPRAPLIAAAILIAATLIGVGIARYTGFDPRVAPPAPSLESRMLSFTPRADGSLVVIDADSRQEVYVLPAGEDGFLRASLHSIARERKRQGIPDDAPYQLIAHRDGHLSLVDTPTGRSFDLGSFGGSNAAVFARLLPSATAAR